MMCIIASELKNLKSTKLDRVLKRLHSTYPSVAHHLTDHRHTDMNAEPNREISKNGLKCCKHHLDKKITGIIYLEAAGGWSYKYLERQS